MNPDSDPAEEAFLRAAREELFPKMENSALYVSICPSGGPDAKFCVKIGAITRMPASEVPSGLARVAHVALDCDLGSDEGLRDFERRLKAFLDEFIVSVADAHLR